MFDKVKSFLAIYKDNKVLKIELEELKNKIYQVEEQYKAIVAQDKSFKSIAKRKVLAVKLGDASKGYVPGSETQEIIVHNLKHAKVDELYNVLLLPYYVQLEELKGKK